MKIDFYIPNENNLMKQVEYLTNLLFSQLGITQTILDGTADEKTMLNYYTRTIEPIIAAMDETIPTQLRLKVNEQYDVYYKRLENTFGYEFIFYKFQGVTNEMARAITDEIVSRMVDQSYDHGAQWREDETREFTENDYTITIVVHFRVRDAG